MRSTGQGFELGARSLIREPVAPQADVVQSRNYGSGVDGRCFSPTG